MIDLGALVTRGMQIATTMVDLKAATITRPASTIDPLTGATTGTPLTQSPTAVALRPSRLQAKAGAAWTEARAALFVDAAALAWVPALADRVQWAGRTGAITAIDVVAPAGTIIGYELAVGA